MQINADGIRVAVDIGGTFTDATVFHPSTGTISVGKSLTTPGDLADGVANALEVSGVALADVALVMHGSTVAINALIERKGASTVLVTTRGIRDVYEIGRANRPDSFNPFFRKHRPLVSRDHILEADERLSAWGEVVQELTGTELDRLVTAIDDLGAEAVAIMFLHSYREPKHEELLKQAILREHPSLFVTASHEITREYREYERTSTTAANAYVGPLVSGYLAELEQRLADSGFAGELLLMQSAGGLYDVASAKQNCIQLLESGPAGGVVGTSALCRQLDLERAIAFDMGGTTTKACVVAEGEASLAPDYFVGGYNDGLAIRIPVLDIKEIGTGGGSIAAADDAGALSVGPTSAGALPGPACYGRGGTQPTITDAHAVLCHFGEDSLLSGEMKLDVAAARAAIDEGVATPLGLDTDAAAAGILAIANVAMANAVRAVTLDRGFDPRDFVLIAYGGAGPLHAVAVARELAIERVIVPPSPGHFSARGMLMGDLRREYVVTRFMPLASTGPAQLGSLFEELETPGHRWFAERGVADSEVSSLRAVEMRYFGQEHTVTVQVEESDVTGGEDLGELKRRFDQVHERLYGHNAPDEQAELVTFRTSLVAALPKLRFTHREGSAGGSGARPIVRRAILDIDEGPVDVHVWPRESLDPGAKVEGPAVVQEVATTTIIPSGTTAVVGSSGELVITVGSGGAR